MNTAVTALSLFSGGLDSILASRVVAMQGIRVIAIKFVSPFFDHEILTDVEGYTARMRKLYDLDVMVEDISEAYLELLHRPAHGFGKNFNPCIDCKIFMFDRARQMMERFGASFLVSGEVLGQRPMSQRRDTLNVIERDSGSRSILLRPLSAKLLGETAAEAQGLVDRSRLLDFSGRGRSRQIALAQSFGIKDFPAPAGGCRLADPILSKRIAAIYRGDFVISPENIVTEDILCLQVGRQFVLPQGGWLVVGRDEKENDRLLRLRSEGDILLTMEDHPGPSALLRHGVGSYETDHQRQQDIKGAAGVVVRFAKKVNGKLFPQKVIVDDGMSQQKILGLPEDGEELQQWIT